MKQGKQYTSKQTIISRQQKQQNQCKYFENGSEQIRCGNRNALWWYWQYLQLFVNRGSVVWKKHVDYIWHWHLCATILSLKVTKSIFLNSYLPSIQTTSLHFWHKNLPHNFHNNKKLWTTSFFFHGPDTVELITVWCSSLSINSFFQAEVQYPAVHFRVCSICTCIIYVCSDQILVMFGYWQLWFIYWNCCM